MHPVPPPDQYPQPTPGPLRADRSANDDGNAGSDGMAFAAIRDLEASVHQCAIGHECG